MTGNRTYADFGRLLAPDGPASAMLRHMISGYVTWRDFAASEMPPGLGVEDAWGLIHLVKQAIGVHIPIPDLDGNEYWYARTHEVSDGMCRIQCLCGPDSSLYRRLHETANRPVLINSRIDETVAAALLDGLEISGADAQDMLLLDRTPRTDHERLVANTLNALDHLDELANEPFSRELLIHLYGLVTDGVDPERLTRTQSRLGILEFDYAPDRVAASRERQLQYMLDYMNHASGDPHDYAIFRGLLLPDIFKLYQPLPAANSQVGRLAFRLYTLKVGLPVLGMLPLSRAKLRWEEECLESALVALAPSEYRDDRSHQGCDLTGYATLSLELALTALQDLQAQLFQLEQRDRELRELLQRDIEINHRQRSILGRALRNPNAEFRIAYHKTTHNVVYATARADLLDLVDRGYLTQGKSGRAMVFHPRKDLHEFIGRGYSRE